MSELRKMFLNGRSETGKTTLTQNLKGEDIHYEKTQYTKTWDITIDTPGEYTESKKFDFALGCFSFDSDVLAEVVAADEPYNLHEPGVIGWATRPMIGIITKIDSPLANVPMVERWLRQSGCERIFKINNVTGEGIEELREYLEQKVEPMTLEEAIAKQNRGILEWSTDETKIPIEEYREE